MEYVSAFVDVAAVLVGFENQATAWDVIVAVVETWHVCKLEEPVRVETDGESYRATALAVQWVGDAIVRITLHDFLEILVVTGVAVLKECSRRVALVRQLLV